MWLLGLLLYGTDIVHAPVALEPLGVSSSPKASLKFLLRQPLTAEATGREILSEVVT